MCLSKPGSSSAPAGVDLSECLQYPDFSVVVLYKKVVVGFGFMVPDVKYNEAYISFLLVHPEWRRAGIGTFMIYHLIQVGLQPSLVSQYQSGSEIDTVPTFDTDILKT